MTEEGEPQGSPPEIISSLELQDAAARLGAEISANYPDGVVLVAVLKGSVIFLADLVRHISVSCEVDFLSITSYAADSGRVRIQKDLDSDILDRDVILVEDIVDTGLTLTYLLRQLGHREPRSLEVCALFDKSARRIVPVPLKFIGFEIGDDFVLGYGLDYLHRYRNVSWVFEGDLKLLVSNPDAYIKQLFKG